METAAAFAGVLGLAGLAAQAITTTIQIRDLCASYAAAEEEIEGVSKSLEDLQNLMEETKRLAESPSVVQATTLLTRTRMANLLKNCQKELQHWIYRIDRAIPTDVSRSKQLWKKIIVVADKPKLVDLKNKTGAYVNQMSGMLGVMRGDLGVATNVTLVGMLWSHGIFEYNVQTQLESINRGVTSLQASQDSFKRGAFTKLDEVGSTVSSIEINIQELLYRSVPRDTKSVATIEAIKTSIPYARNGNFVGRESVLEEVKRKLELPKSNNRVALYGLGGVGKSQIAMEIAYRASSVGFCCLWVSAVSRTTFAQSYREIASTLKIEGVDNPQNDGLDLIKLWLQREKTVPWLMVVDNVDDLRSLSGAKSDGHGTGFNFLKYLPQCNHGKLLFTTRSRIAALKLTGVGMIVDIPNMDVSEAQQLLQVRLDEDSSQTSQDCLELVKALECLPLAISHAAAYMKEREITPSNYLRLFNHSNSKKRQKLLEHPYEDLAREEGQSNTVITTWQISFEQIENESPASASLLKVMGSLHYHDIPQYLLQQDELEDEDDFHEAITPLIAFSLVQRSSDSTTFSMHRLVRIAIRSWPQAIDWETTAEKFLLHVFPHLGVYDLIPTETDALRCRQLLPHSQSFLDLLGTSDILSVRCIQLKFRTAAGLKLLGQNQQARLLYESITDPLLELSKRDISTGISSMDVEDEIIRLYFLEGSLSNIPMQRAQKVLKIRSDSLPGHCLDVASAKSLVALGYIAQANYKEAESLLQESYKATVESVGKTDMRTVVVLFALASAYSGQEQYEKAADTHKLIMDLIIPLHGENNELVMECESAIAQSRRCLYRTQEAGVLIRKALAHFEKMLGPDHHRTTLAVLRLGFQLADEGNKVGAFAAYERAWKNYQRMYGEDSSWALSCVGHMASAHESSVEAEQMLRDAIRRSTVTWGPFSSTTMRLEDCLFSVLVQNIAGAPMDTKDKVESFARTILENRTKELGPDSKSTLKAATDVAICLGLQFRADEAEKLYLATLERQVKFVGTHSRDTYITRGAIAGIYVFKRNWCAAEIVLHQQIEILEEVAGPFHKNTLDRKSFLGSVISMGYRFNKTETNKLRAIEGGAMMHQVYEDFTKHHDGLDLLVLGAACRLAKYHEAMNELEEAESLYQKVVEGYHKSLGKEAMVTVATQVQLGLVMVKAKRFKEALPILERVHNFYKLKAADNPFDPLVAAWILGSCLICMEGEREPEGWKILKTDAIDRSDVLFGEGNFFSTTLQKLYDDLRDSCLLDETTYKWGLTDADRRTKSCEFEACFPFKGVFPNDTMSKPLRRVSSWYLASATPRLYQGFVSGQREVDFRDLRGAASQPIETIESTESDPAEATCCFQCQVCENGIPTTELVCVCRQPSCADRFGLVCMSCHNKGLSCVHSTHKPHFQEQNLKCGRCNGETQIHNAWRCSTCPFERCLVCVSCYDTGKGCSIGGHKLVKAWQPASQTDGQWYCDICENNIEVDEFRWSCDVCGDYDVCTSCWDKGKRCRDSSHVLVKRDGNDLGLGEEKK